MNWLQVISIIVGSSVLSVLLNIWYSAHQEEKKKQEERREKLYGPLKFYLAILDANKSTKEELQKANKENYERITQSIDDNRQKMTVLVKSTSQFHVDVISPGIMEWWLYIDKIKEILELHSGCIENKHWELVRKFIKNYILRERVVGKNIYKDTSSILPFETIKNAFDGLHDAIEEMKKEIL